MTGPILYESYSDMYRAVRDMATRMPDVDAIAGVPSSGLAPAGMLSAVTGIKTVPIEAVPDGVKRLLVLEDASGFAKFKNQKMGVAEGREVFYGAVYACGAAMDIDMIGCVAEKPRVFTWNLFKSDRAKSIAYDMDGVLCVNPTMDQIDYGPKYAVFIDTVQAIQRVRTKLGWIVTGRMERYRAQTEAWLTANGIEYGELIMAADDQKHTMEAHAKYKAAWYNAEPKCQLFVESHSRQAARIAELTGRAVVCAETEHAWNTRKPEPVPVGKRNDRIIYTISTGDYEQHAPRSYRPPPGWDYRLITSADCPQYLSPKQQAAWAKINGPRIFAEYDASLCVDDDMTVLADPSPLLTGPLVFLWRDNVSTWHKDLSLTASTRRAATREQVDTEIARLTSAGFSDSENYLTGVVYREHTDQARALCDEWWYWYGQSETRRDQPSLAVSLQKLGIVPEAITEQGMVDYIVHDIRKADRDGVRIRTGDTEPHSKKPRRRGDKV